MTSDFWTPARVAQLQRLVNARLPYSEIGDMLGCTKNAAIGKARRLGFSPRYIPPPKPPRVILRFPTPNECAYPIGDPKQPLFRFCAEPTDGSAWCETHHALCSTPPKEKEMRAP